MDLLELPAEIVTEIVSWVPTLNLVTLTETCKCLSSVALRRSKPVRKFKHYLGAILNDDILAVLRTRNEKYYHGGLFSALKYGRATVFDIMVARYDIFSHNSIIIWQYVEQACKYNSVSLILRYWPMEQWSYEVLVSALYGAIQANNVALVKELIPGLTNNPEHRGKLRRDLNVSRHIARGNNPTIRNILTPYISVTSCDEAVGAARAGDWERFKETINFIAGQGKLFCVNRSMVEAIENKQLHIVKQLVQHYPVNLSMAFSEAVFDGDIEIVTFFINSVPKADIDTVLKPAVALLYCSIKCKLLRLIVENFNTIDNYTLHVVLENSEHREKYSAMAYVTSLLFMRIEY